MTAAELSRLTGIPKQCLSDWLGGTRPRDITMVKSIAAVLKVPVLELMYGPEIQGKSGAEGGKSFSTGSGLAGVNLDFLYKYSRDLFQIRKMPAGTLLALSKSWESILGWAKSDIEAKLWQEFIHPEDWPATSECIERSLSTGAPVQYCRHRFMHKNAEWLPFESTLEVDTKHSALTTISTLIKY